MDRDDNQGDLFSTSSSPPPVPRKSSADTSNGSPSHYRFPYEEYGLRELKKLLYNATAQLEAEGLRASEAERELRDLTGHLQRVNDARLAALHEATKAKEELKYVLLSSST